MVSRKRCLARWVMPQDCVAVRNARERQQERRVAVVGEQRDQVHSVGEKQEEPQVAREQDGIHRVGAGRGNRNISLLLKEKREQLKQSRQGRFKKCERVSSKDVGQEWVQDRSKPMVIVGSDAVSLFPSLTKIESSNEVTSAVMETDLVWEGVDWKEAVRFIVLGRDITWCRKSKLARVLPQRRYKKGTRPGLTGSGPLGAEAGDEKQWEFGPSPALTEMDKKLVMSEVLRLATEIMFETHLYNFNGRSYNQREGGPIGLRSTCALSRVVMGRWDVKWNTRMTANNIKVEEDGRFVDDARVFMFPVRPGWRWQDGGLWYMKEWEEQDKLLSPTEVTKRMVFDSM